MLQFAAFVDQCDVGQRGEPVGEPVRDVAQPARVERVGGHAQHDGIGLPNVPDDQRTVDARGQLRFEVVEMFAHFAQRSVGVLHLVVELDRNVGDARTRGAGHVQHVRDAAQIVGDLLGDELLDVFGRRAGVERDDFGLTLLGAGIFAALHRQRRGDRPEER